MWLCCGAQCPGCRHQLVESIGLPRWKGVPVSKSQRHEPSLGCAGGAVRGLGPGVGTMGAVLSGPICNPPPEARAYTPCGPSLRRPGTTLGDWLGRGAPKRCACVPGPPRCVLAGGRTQPTYPGAHHREPPREAAGGWGKTCQQWPHRHRALSCPQVFFGTLKE